MSKRLASPYETSFLPPVARDSDSVTSHAGHDKIQPKRGTRMAEVLALLKAYPKGLTAQEVEAFLTYTDRTTGKRVTGWWKRLSDLKNAGLVEGTGETRDGGEIYRAT